MTFLKKINYAQQLLQRIWTIGLMEKWSCIWVPIAIGIGKPEYRA